MSYSIETISSPHQSGRGGHKPELIVCHIADGSYAGTKSWFLNVTSQTSSHYVLGQEGQICECVPLDKMAWCNGTATDASDNRYYGHSTVALVRQRGGNANQYSVSMECEGYYSRTQGALTDKQLDALVWLIRKIQSDVKAQYGNTIPFDRAHIVGHYEINPKTKPHCPGERFPWDTLIGRLKEGQAGTLYRVQSGAFTLRSGADILAAKLQAKRHETILVKDGGLYKVQLGAFTRKSSADALAEKLRSQGFDAFITTKAGVPVA